MNNYTTRIVVSSRCLVSLYGFTHYFRYIIKIFDNLMIFSKNNFETYCLDLFVSCCFVFLYLIIVSIINWSITKSVMSINVGGGLSVLVLFKFFGHILSYSRHGDCSKRKYRSKNHSQFKIGRIKMS